MVLVPLLAVILYNFFEEKDRSKKDVTQDVLRVVNSFASQQKFFEESTRQLLSVMEQIPEIRGKDTSTINKFFDNLLKKNPAYTTFLICDRKGNLIASNVRNKPINISDRKYYHDVISKTMFSVGEYVQSRLTSKPSIHYAWPLFNVNNEIQLILIAEFNLNYYYTLFQNENMGENATYELLDYKGIVLYGSSNLLIKPGIKEREHIVEILKTKSSGTFEDYDMKGVKRLFGFHAVSLTYGNPYLYILVSKPIKEAYAEYRHVLIRNLLLWSLTAIIVIITSLLFIRRQIVRNIDLLVRSARHIAEGNLSKRTRINYNAGEIGILASSFDNMAEKLQSREIERKDAENRINILKERFEMAVNSAKIGIWDWIISQNILIWDKNMFSLYEIDPDKFDQNFISWKLQIHPEDRQRFEDEINNIVIAKTNYRSEFRINTSQSGIKHIRIFANVICDHEGKPIRLIGVNWDITERKELENKLIAAIEKTEFSDKLKSAFLANMSHEIRTPLNGIIGFSQLIKELNVVPENKQQYIDIIIQSSYHLLNIVNDILDISIIESGQLKINYMPTDINATLDEINAFFQKAITNDKKNIDLVVYKDKNSFTQLTDKQRLLQVFNNLIGNALKFTTDGRITFGYEINDESVKYFVKDTGIGIASEYLSKIFDRFKQIDDGYTRTYGGTGLGLAICKSLVEIMGGKIWVESTVGKGSEFYFILPVVN
jgi:signal transduction histidine kinase/HAMP domain-containing protein